MTDTQNWRDLGRGTGKRPEGVSDGDLVRRIDGDDWAEFLAIYCQWHAGCEYQVLEPSPTTDRAEEPVMTDNTPQTVTVTHEKRCAKCGGALPFIFWGVMPELCCRCAKLASPIGDAT